MKLLEDRIRRDGVVVDNEILKVDRFLNHQMDIGLFVEMGKEWARLFGTENVTKILTIEASGIGIACVTAEQFNCPVIFAKKSKTRNIAGEVYSTTVKSFTHGNTSTVIVSKQFLRPEDKVLLIDDFLANGAALEGLVSWCGSPAPPLWGPVSPWRRPSSLAGIASAQRACGWRALPGSRAWIITILSFAR
jgi:xanthine phosphoribosyltransferase